MLGRWELPPIALFIRYTYPAVSEFPTPVPHMLRRRYTRTIDYQKLTVDFHGLDAFCLEKGIADRTSSFVYSFSTVAIIHLTLGKRALFALVNKVATW
jgi:hypothetical protein